MPDHPWRQATSGVHVGCFLVFARFSYCSFLFFRQSLPVSSVIEHFCQASGTLHSNIMGANDTRKNLATLVSSLLSESATELVT